MTVDGFLDECFARKFKVFGEIPTFEVIGPNTRFRVRAWDGVIDIAYSEGFDRWANSTTHIERIPDDPIEFLNKWEHYNWS